MPSRGRLGQRSEGGDPDQERFDRRARPRARRRGARPAPAGPATGRGPRRAGAAGAGPRTASVTRTPHRRCAARAPLPALAARPRGPGAARSCRRPAPPAGPARQRCRRERARPWRQGAHVPPRGRRARVTVPLGPARCTGRGSPSDRDEDGEEEHAAGMTDYDVMVVGGSAAGLSAALVLSEPAGKVLVVDSGAPRNAPAAHMHGFLSRDGMPPADLLAVGRQEVRGYGGEVREATVSGVVAHQPMGFAASLSDGEPGLRAPTARGHRPARRASRHPRPGAAVGERRAALPVLPRPRGGRPAAWRAWARTRSPCGTPRSCGSGRTTSPW